MSTVKSDEQFAAEYGEGSELAPISTKRILDEIGRRGTYSKLVEALEADPDLDPACIADYVNYGLRKGYIR